MTKVYHFRPLIFLILSWIALCFFVDRYAGGTPIQVHISTRFWNTEVQAHFLNILKRYQSHDISHHWFALGPPCPSVNETCALKRHDADQPFTALISSERLNGEVVYTSFPPGAMILSYFIVDPLSHFTGWPLNIDMLIGLNFVFWLTSVIIFFFALQRIVPQELNYREWVIFAAALPLLFSVESLHSHHLSLWAHQVFQVILASVFFVLTFPLTRRTILALGLLSMIGCWVEWTAYFLCIAIFITLLWRTRNTPSVLRLKYLTNYSLIALSGGFSLLLYYHELIGIGRYFKSQQERFSQRTVVDYYGWKDGLLSVMESYGPWVIVCGVLSVILMSLVIFEKAKQKKELLPTMTQWALLFVSVFILLENALMLEHAITYTFDHLKWGFFLSIIIAITGSKLVMTKKYRGALALSFLVGLAAIYSIFQYMKIYHPY